MPILAAVDGETVPSETIDVGSELARQFETQLVALHVMQQDVFDEFQEATGGRKLDFPLAPEVTYGGRLKSSSSEHQYSIEDGERNAANVAQDVVKATIDDPRDVTYQGRVGDPVKEILNEADRRDVRYLVIGGRQRTPVGKAVFGSTTQSLLLNSNLPVMTVMRE